MVFRPASDADLLGTHGAKEIRKAKASGMGHGAMVHESGRRIGSRSSSTNLATTAYGGWHTRICYRHLCSSIVLGSSMRSGPWSKSGQASVFLGLQPT